MSMIGRVLFLMLVIVGVLGGVAVVWGSMKKLLVLFRVGRVDEKRVSDVVSEETVKVTGTLKTHPEHGFLDNSPVVDSGEYLFVDWEVLHKKNQSWDFVTDGVNGVPVLLQGEDLNVVQVNLDEVEEILLDSFEESSEYVHRTEAGDKIDDVLSENGINHNRRLQVRRDCLQPGDEVTVVGDVQPSENPRSASRFIIVSGDSTIPFTVTDWSSKRFIMQTLSMLVGILFGLVTIGLGVWLLIDDLITPLYSDYAMWGLLIWVVSFFVYVTGVDFVYWANSKWHKMKK